MDMDSQKRLTWTHRPDGDGVFMPIKVGDIRMRGVNGDLVTDYRHSDGVWREYPESRVEAIARRVYQDAETAAKINAYNRAHLHFWLSFWISVAILGALCVAISEWMR